MGHEKSIPGIFRFLAFSALLVILAGCASHQDLQLAGDNNNLDEFRNLSSDELNPYRPGEDGRIPFRQLLSHYEPDQRPEWVEQRLAESRDKAKEVLARIEEDQLSLEGFRQMLEDPPFYLDVRFEDEETKKPLMQAFSESGRSEFITALADAGASANRKASDEWTPLIRAVFNGDLATVDALLRVGADPNLRSVDDWAPMHVVANASGGGNRENDLAIGQRLIDAGANINARNNNGNTPLYLAVLHERPEVRDFLIQKGAELDKGRDDGWTPLIKAVYDGNVAAVKALAAAGANLDTKEEDGWSPLHFTANDPSNGNRDHDADIARILIGAGADLERRNATGRTPLHLAIGNQRAQIRDILLRAGANPDTRKENSWTPLMDAVYTGNQEAVKGLVEAGADLDISTDDGWKALHFTANNPDNGNRKHDVAIAEYLINSGARLSATDSTGKTPLYIAVDNGRDKVRDLLISAGANLDTQRNDGWTPLINAVYDGKPEAAKALLEAGASVSVQADGGWTALHITANSRSNGNREHDLKMARMLVEAGAGLEARKENGSTPLNTAVWNGRPEIRDLLISQGADVGTREGNGMTPLMNAVYQGSRDAASALIEAGADVNARKPESRWTALHYTANTTENGDRGAHDAALARLLIENGADVNALTEAMFTPLMLTAINGRYAVTEALLEAGARTDLDDRDGNTALEWARHEENYAVAAAIAEAENEADSDKAHHESRYPAAPPEQAGRTTCRTRCFNGDCFRTYGDGSRKRFQAERRYDSMSGEWEYEPGPC